MYPPLSCVFVVKSDPSHSSFMFFVNSKPSHIYYSVSIKSSLVCIIINHKQLISVIPYRPICTYLHLSVISTTLMFCLTDLVFISFCVFWSILIHIKLFNVRSNIESIVKCIKNYPIP